MKVNINPFNIRVLNLEDVKQNNAIYLLLDKKDNLFRKFGKCQSDMDNRNIWVSETHPIRIELIDSRYEI